MNRSDTSRNGYMLRGPLARRGYDWWWHNFTARHRETGEERSFFIEYYVCNPALGSDKPAFGQLSDSGKPSYVMIKAGFWGEGAKQIHRFLPMNQFSCPADRLDLKAGDCLLTETAMSGRVSLSEEERRAHPEYMSDAGEISWDLKIDKQIAFHVGYGASRFFRRLNAFEMFWHAEGIKTEYAGSVTADGEEYQVISETSFGYADKNWGGDFTSPWLWIGSCDLTSRHTGLRLTKSALEFGGGCPKVFGLPLNRRLLGSLVHEGKVYEYNFAKFWKYSSIDFRYEEGEKMNRWYLTAKNRTSILQLELECPAGEMLFINYEAPDGHKRHNRLWNGGTGRGVLTLTDRRTKQLIDTIDVGHTGCEYGEYDE